MGSVWAICWALAVFEHSNSKIYSEAVYLQKTLKAADTHKFLCCI